MPVTNGQIDYTFFGASLPSKKNKERILFRGKTPFIKASVEYCNWELSHVATLKHLFGSPKLKRFSLEITRYAPNNRVRDIANTLNSIQDCLVKGEVLKDDRDAYMIKAPVLNYGENDPLNPRVEVKITWDQT